MSETRFIHKSEQTFFIDEDLCIILKNSLNSFVVEPKNYHFGSFVVTSHIYLKTSFFCLFNFIQLNTIFFRMRH